MYKVEDLKTVFIGRRGEENARVIEIDIGSMQKAFPDAEASIILHRPGEDTPILCSTSVVDNVLYWTIGAADTSYAGMHPFEVRLADEDMLLKSKVGIAVVERAVGDTVPEDAPEDVQTWIDALQEKIAWVDELYGLESTDDDVAYILGV